MADEYLASLDVNSAVVGKLLKFAPDDLIQHAGGIDPKNPLQFTDRVRPGLDRILLAVDGHLDELG